MNFMVRTIFSWIKLLLRITQIKVPVITETEEKPSEGIDCSCGDIVSRGMNDN